MGVRQRPVQSMHLELPVRKKEREKVGEALGMIPVFGSLAMAIGYTVVMGWILRYAVGTFTGATLSPENVDEFGRHLVRWRQHLVIIYGRYLRLWPVC